MRFLLTSTEPFLFFTVPAQGEIEKAYEIIAQSCRDQAKALYGNNNEVVSRLETELELMKTTDTAFHFLLLKEITDYSKEQGYPILIMGNLSGSIIAYLLGASSVNPMPPHYHCPNHCELSFEADPSALDGYDLPEEVCPVCGASMIRDGHAIDWRMIWEKDGDTIKLPTVDAFIAYSVRKNLQRHLEYIFGDCKSDHSLYRKMALSGVRLDCERIGKLQKVTGNPFPDSVYYDRECRNNTFQAFLADYKDDELLAQKAESDMDFITSIAQMTEISFSDFIKISAYRHGTFYAQKSLEKWRTDDYYILRDDFFSVLMGLGLPWDIAMRIAKFGAHGRDCSKYETLLKQANVPQAIFDHCKEVGHLWAKAPCIVRLQQDIVIEWYKTNFPEAFEQVNAMIEEEYEELC